MSDWLEKYNKADTELFDIPCRLNRLASAFCETGNVIVGEELYGISEAIERHRKEMKQAVSQSITEACNHSQENSATILKAALAGVGIALGD